MLSNREKTKYVKKFNERWADIQRNLGQNNSVVQDYKNKVSAVLGEEYLARSFSGNWKIKTDYYSKLNYTAEALEKLLNELPTFGQLKYAAEQEEERKLTKEEFIEMFQSVSDGKEIFEWLILYVDPSALWRAINSTLGLRPGWEAIGRFCRNWIKKDPDLRKIWNLTHDKGQRL